MKNKFLYIIGSSLLCLSCNSIPVVQKPADENNFTFSSIAALRVKETSQADASKIFGEPTKKIQSVHLPETAWIYNDSKTGHQRLSLVFDKSGKLFSILWLVTENDPEINIEVAKEKFPAANFLAKDAVWINPHAAPDERFYTDTDKGINITFRKARSEVGTISWYDTQNKELNRQPATKWIKYTRKDGLVSIKPQNPDDLIW